MYKGKLVIDAHGHISTPPHFRAFAMNLMSLRTTKYDLAIPEAAMAAAQERHLSMMDERNIDVQLLSPRPVAMMHWERPFVVEKWTKTTNDLIASQCRLHPKRFVGIAQLPQNAHQPVTAALPELERCIKDLGFVGAIVNPDPGGDRTTPGMDNEYWFPLYEKAEELDATLVVHPSLTRDPRVERIPHSYQYNNLTEEALAVQLLEYSDVFQRHPKLRVVVCHCGGALRRMLDHGGPMNALAAEHGEDSLVRPSGQQAGGQVGQSFGRVEDAKPDLSKNLFFDTCAYDPYFLGTAIRQRGANRMVFGTEVPGSGSGVLNPETGKPSDDVLAMLDHFDFLNDDDRVKMVHDNVRRAFPLLERVFF
ncbi:amidohydrolase family protein [Pigmentiphaga kullae]|uniref:4-oxalmesaconate hydratase n=1 Tax=Pigmentiphaga kullae TaxID=151784 RepID=A0A4Q7NN29_9BURK|nr:amidohydrolase family protein [Pigmentiphaga kullae]RZS86609.1 4-oxalmesaconate hydratase [Pigmentiphaga kullae]